MPTRVRLEIGELPHPALALLVCHCGKWAFRVDSHFPLFDPGPAAKRPSAGCPIDWHVVPTADDPAPVRTTKRASNSISLAPALISEIREQELLAREDWIKLLPESITPSDLAFFGSL